LQIKSGIELVVLNGQLDMLVPETMSPEETRSILNRAKVLIRVTDTQFGTATDMFMQAEKLVNKIGAKNTPENSELLQKIREVGRLRDNYPH